MSTTTRQRVGGDLTTCSPVGRYALVCVTCADDGVPLVLSVAEPVGFDGWLYPHTDHERHELVTLDPAGLVIDCQPAEVGALAMPRHEGTHGTESAYQRHRKRNEEACRACREAHCVYQNERRYRSSQKAAEAGPHYRCGECGHRAKNRRAIVRHIWAEHDRPPRAAERQEFAS